MVIVEFQRSLSSIQATTLQNGRPSGFCSIISAVLLSQARQNAVLILPLVLCKEINRSLGTWKCSCRSSVYSKGCISFILFSRAFNLRFCPRDFFLRLIFNTPLNSDFRNSIIIAQFPCFVKEGNMGIDSATWMWRTVPKETGKG